MTLLFIFFNIDRLKATCHVTVNSTANCPVKRVSFAKTQVVSHFLVSFAPKHNLAQVSLQSLRENNSVLWDFAVNPSAVRAADLMALRLDSAERDCSLSFKGGTEKRLFPQTRLTLLGRSNYVRRVQPRCVKHFESGHT